MNEQPQLKLKPKNKLQGAYHHSQEREEGKYYQEDPLKQELTNIANGEDFIVSLQSVQIAFTRIPTLQALQHTHNLVELTLIEAGISSLQGIQATSHSLEILHVVSNNNLLIIEDCFLSLQNLRELSLAQCSITVIENLQNCRLLRKLHLYSNKIGGIEKGLDFNLALQYLSLQDNLITTLRHSSLSRLSNLEDLALSGNPITNLEDVQDIALLPALKSVSFWSQHFQPCPICDLPNYRDYIIASLHSGASFQGIQSLDSQYLQMEDFQESENAYASKVIALQSQLKQIESDHRHAVLSLDSKSKENYSHLQSIQGALVDQLHQLKDIIDSGREKILNEYEELRQIRVQSQEVLRGQLQGIQQKYHTEVQNLIQNQEINVKNLEELGKSCVDALKFERDIHLALLDVLYTSQGTTLYSQMKQNSPQFSFVAQILQNNATFQKVSTGGGVLEKLSLNISKCFSISQPVNNKSYGSSRVFFSLQSVDQLSDLLLNKREGALASLKSISIYKNAGNCALTSLKQIQLEPLIKPVSNILIVVARLNKKSEQWQKWSSQSTLAVQELSLQNISDFSQKMMIEFVSVLKVSVATKFEENFVYQQFNDEIDEHLLSLISDTMSLPAQKLDALAGLEREALQKYCDHQRRVWGELDSSTLKKFQQQQEQLLRMQGSLEGIKQKIEGEHHSQEQMIKEMRAAIIENNTRSAQKPVGSKK